MRLEQLPLHEAEQRLLDHSAQRGGDEVTAAVVVHEIPSGLLQLRCTGDVGHQRARARCQLVDVPRVVHLRATGHREQVPPGLRVSRCASQLGQDLGHRCVEVGEPPLLRHDADGGGQDALRDGEDITGDRSGEVLVDDDAPADAHVQVRGVRVPAVRQVRDEVLHRTDETSSGCLHRRTVAACSGSCNCVGPLRAQQRGAGLVLDASVEDGGLGYSSLGTGWPRISGRLDVGSVPCSSVTPWALPPRR